MQSRSPYEILGIPENSGFQKIRKAYLQAVLETHPDKPGGDAEKFRAIHEAYELLSDSNKRENYKKLSPDTAEPKRNTSTPLSKEAAAALQSLDKMANDVFDSSRYGRFVRRSFLYRKRINEEFLPKLSEDENLLESILSEVNELIEEALEIKKELDAEITKQGEQANHSIEQNRTGIINEIAGFRALELPLTLLLLDRDIKDPLFLNNLATAQQELIRKAITSLNKNERWDREPKIVLIAIAHLQSASSIESTALQNIGSEGGILVPMIFRWKFSQKTQDFAGLLQQFYACFNDRLIHGHISDELTRRVRNENPQPSALLTYAPQPQLAEDEKCSTDEMLRFVEKVHKNECRKVHVINEYSNELAGHATVYTHGHGLFNETKALLTGKRKIFANLRAWWNNDGILLADTRALLAGKRPFMANTRNYLFSNPVQLDKKSTYTRKLHPK